MLHLVTLMLFAAPSIGPTIGEHYGHAGGGPDPWNLVILPPKVPNCRTEEEIRKALAEKAQDLPQSCDPPRQSRQVERR